MSKSEILINLATGDLAYLEKITKELGMSSVQHTVEKIIHDAGRDWFDAINKDVFMEKLNHIPIDELADVICSIPFLSRRYSVDFDEDIVNLVVERLLDWEDAISTLVRTLYRLNNIRIMARDLKNLIEELSRKLPDDSGIELSIYDREAVIRLLVSALYRS